MKEIPEEEPQDTAHNFEDRNDTPILEVYDNRPQETDSPVGPVTRSNTRQKVSSSETKQIRRYTHCDDHAVQFTPSPSKCIAPSLTKNLPTVLSTRKMKKHKKLL